MKERGREKQLSGQNKAGFGEHIISTALSLHTQGSVKSAEVVEWQRK